VSALLAFTRVLMTGKTNVRPVDGAAVTDRNKHEAEDENEVTQKWTVLA
jgi:hypothetical protein